MCFVGEVKTEQEEVSDRGAGGCFFLRFVSLGVVEWAAVCVCLAEGEGERGREGKSQ